MLQTSRLPRDGRAVPFVSDFFDFSIYIDADEAIIRRWYIERFLRLRETAFRDPASYFHRYAAIERRGGERDRRGPVERGSTSSISRENILPTRPRADLILSKERQPRDRGGGAPAHLTRRRAPRRLIFPRRDLISRPTPKCSRPSEPIMADETTTARSRRTAAEATARRDAGRRADRRARGRGRRPQGPAAADARRDGESPPAHRARDRRHAPVCGRQFRPRHADGRRQSAPRHRRGAGGARDGRDPALAALIEGVEVTERGLAQTLAEIRRQADRGQGPEIRPDAPPGDVRGRGATTCRPAPSPRTIQAGYVIGERVLRPALVGDRQEAARKPAADKAGNDTRPSRRRRTSGGGRSERLEARDLGQRPAQRCPARSASRGPRRCRPRRLGAGLGEDVGGQRQMAARGLRRSSPRTRGWPARRRYRRGRACAGP